MTETARLAHYVLPASSQFEKTEFTLFNFEFPTNYFHLRAGVRARRCRAPCPSRRSTRGSPGDGHCCPATTRWRRCARPPSARAPRLRHGASRASDGRQSAARSRSARSCSTTRSAPPCPTARPPPRRLWQAAHLCAKRSPQAVRRALDARPEVPDEMLGEALFDAHRRDRANGAAFTAARLRRGLVADRASRPQGAPGDRAELLEWLGRLDRRQTAAARRLSLRARRRPAAHVQRQPDLPRSGLAPRRSRWRAADQHLPISTSLGANDGDWIAVQSARRPHRRARCRRDDSMRSGQLALPHGYGQTIRPPTASG